MANLMEGLDDSFWNAVPSPDNSPVKPRHVAKSSPLKIPRTPVRPKREPVALVATPSKIVYSAGDIDMSTFLEGAEDWDLDIELSPRKPSPKKEKVSPNTQPLYVPESCTRCIVESVDEEHINGRWVKRLRARIDSTERLVDVILQDDWYLTDIRIEDIFNVLGTFSSNSITISSQTNLLVLHPDIMLTATAMSNAPQCRRKPLLSSLVHSSSDITPSLVWGSILHEVMQKCLSENCWDERWIEDRIDEAVRASLGDLFKLNVSVEDAKREIIGRAKGLQVFSQRYLSETPKPDAILTNTRSKANDGPSLLAISKLLDIEEDIWSPTYGLKGKLDATVNAVISELPPRPSSNFFKAKPLPTPPQMSSGPQPFEIKTGRAVAGMEHRAQTMLYTLLASERYGVDVPSGLLYYTQSDEVVRVPRGRNELRGLVVARNELAAYMMRRIRKKGDIEEPFLPPAIDDERTCKRCYALDTCMIYRRTMETPPAVDSPLHDTYLMKTGHLTDSQAEFFKKWEALLTLEERNLVRFRKELWTMGAEEREKRGRCFSQMVLKKSEGDVFSPSLPLEAPKIGQSKIHSFSYCFVRSADFLETPGKMGRSLISGSLSPGDAIMLSVEPHFLALARGFILSLTSYEVIVGVDHSIDLPTIKKRLSLSNPQRRCTEDVIFRIDKDELFGGMSRMRNNLAQLFYADGDSRTLDLVVDLKTPLFSPVSSLPAEAELHTRHLNPSQRAAMTKVLSAEDYSLILGMPGTGKTTVIAALIRTLVEMGKTVLLSSFTHSAVDTILMKLDGVDFGVLRIGNMDKIHPDVRKYTISARKTATTVEQLEQQFMTPPVVATTCLSIDHPLFSRRKFDYCIVDEASQITLPTCLGPLRFATKFVLVGDHFQLPPLVNNPEARKGGLDVSLFRRLSDSHPNSVVDLTYQYRMNEDIMLLSNRLIYHDRLRCGSDEVAQRSLVIPDRSFLEMLHVGELKFKSSGDCWLKKLADESCKAIFVDTDEIPAHDSRIGDLVQNEVEATLVHQFTETLLRCGVSQNQIGVISLYRQQVKLLSNLLEARKGVEILTADRSQGRDKDCIIVSLVRSNDAGQIGDLVKDWRRMNVSFTRARSKLVIFGSRKTLQADPLLSQFFALMESRHWILKLPPGAHTIYAAHFEVCTTPSKRTAVDAVGSSEENKPLNSSPERPQKRLRATPDAGLLRGRPILQDLANNEI